MTSMRTRPHSFVGGELSTSMFGRPDDPKYAHGLALQRNIVTVGPTGAAMGRPGTRFVRSVRNPARKCRLIPYGTGGGETFQVELGDRQEFPASSTVPGYARFHRGGATVLHSTAWSGAAAYQVGDTVISGGVLYLCTVAHTGQAPPNASFWLSLEWSLSVLYQPGELVSYLGSVYYCFREVVNTAPDVATTRWYVQPTSGVYEIPTTLELTEADLFAATYSQEGNTLSLATGVSFVCELSLTAATAAKPAMWRWRQASFTPTLPAPVNVDATATRKGAALRILSMTGVGSGGSVLAIDTDGDHQLVPGLDFVRIEGSANAALNGNFYGVRDGGTPARFVLVNPETGQGVGMGTTAGGGTVRVAKLNSDTSNSYVVTAVDENDRESQPSAVATVDNNLFVTGAFNTVTWNAVAGAVRYRVYKERADTGLYGLIGEAETAAFKDDSIAPELGISPPKLDDTLGSAPDDWTVAGARGDLPRAVAHVEGRRVVAGTVDEPQSVWATRSNTESDLSYGLPTKDTDRIKQQIKARVACTIRHLVPLGQLVALTDTTEFRITAANSDALTPESFAARAQSYFGAAAVQPVVVDNVLLFVGARGGRVYQMGYSSEANGYLTIDVTERVTHRFDGFTIAQMASQRAPVPIVWAARSDGKLLGMTFVPSQQVFAWHLHDFQGGEVESVSVGGEGAEDRVYVVVKRTIDGNVVRYIEQLAPFGPTAWDDSWQVDCGLRYEGAPVTTITGLEHLEGETVSVFADGLVQSQKVVSSGQIELDVAASKVLVGLPIAYELQTLPAAFAVEAFGSGRPKSVSRVWVRVEASGAFELGPSLEDMVRPFEIEQAGPGVPFSGEVEVRVPNEWTDTGQLFLRQTDPVPLHLMFITAEMAVGG